MEELTQLIKSFTRSRILVIGDVILDSYVSGFSERISREAPVPIIDVKEETVVPGGAGNTAANISSLGATAILVSVAGTDHDAHTVLPLLKKSGVDIGHVLPDSKRKTLVKRRIVSDGQQVVRLDYGSTDVVTHDTESRLLKHCREAAKDCDAIIVSDYGFGVVTENIIEALRELKEQTSIPVMVDSKHLGRYRHMHPTMAKPNYKETMALVQTEPLHNGGNRYMQIRGYAQELLSITGADTVAVTLDAQGACIIEKNGDIFHKNARFVQNPKTAGAGDTFAGAFTLSIAAGASVSAATDIALSAASIVVEKEATNTCTREELMSAYRSCPPRILTSLSQLEALVQQYRILHKRIVFTNGCFDIVHTGHTEYLHQAKELGDVLIIGVNSDESVRRLKGDNRPVNTLADRMLVLSALTSVDHVISFSDPTPVRVIEKIQPDVYVKGADYRKDELPEVPVVESYGGTVRILPYIKDRSTTNIIKRIRRFNEQKGARA